MPEVVETEVDNASTLDSMAPGIANTGSFCACIDRKHGVSIKRTALCVLREQVQGIPGERYHAAIAVLGLVEGQRTALYRDLFLLTLHAARRRVRSSGLRKRTLPRGALSLVTFRMGESSSQPHSLTATVRACDKAAR
jgi:hypothetical protein